jgi:hypothetical protein
LQVISVHTSSLLKAYSKCQSSRVLQARTRTTIWKMTTNLDQKVCFGHFYPEHWSRPSRSSALDAEKETRTVHLVLSHYSCWSQKFGRRLSNYYGCYPTKFSTLRCLKKWPHLVIWAQTIGLTGWWVS